jgi:hypothetical protein
MTWTNHHMCMDILGVLSLPDKEIKRRGFTNEDGTDATPRDIREFMKEQLKLGYDFFTIGDCNNRDKTGRCAGHIIPDEEDKLHVSKTEA